MAVSNDKITQQKPFSPKKNSSQKISNKKRNKEKAMFSNS